MSYFVYYLLSVLILITYKFEVYISIFWVNRMLLFLHLKPNFILSVVFLCRGKIRPLATNAIVFIYPLYVLVVCFLVNAKQRLVISSVTA